MTRWLKNEEGSGLVLALMTLLVLSVLGLFLGTLTISGRKMSNINREASSAYYIAEAGANMAYEDMRTIVSEVYNPQSNEEAFFNSIELRFEDEISKYPNDELSKYSDFEPQFGQEPKANIEIHLSEDQGDERVYTIESVSNLGNHSRTAQKNVTVTWVGKESDGGDNQPPFIPKETAIVAKSKIDFIGGTIIGDIYIDSPSPNAFMTGDWGTISTNNIFYNPSNNVDSLFNKRNHSYNIDHLLKASKPRPDNKPIPWDGFNQLVSLIPNIESFKSVPNRFVEIASGNIPLDFNIQVESFKPSTQYGKTITIDTKGEDRFIITDNLYLGNGNTVKIVGGGSVTFLVTDEMRPQYNWNGSINMDGEVQNLKIIYTGTDDISLDNNFNFNGSIHLIQSKLTLSGASIYGAILYGGTDEILISNASGREILLIAPKTQVNHQGGNLKGTIIADSVKIENGGKIEFNKKYSLEEILNSNSTEDGLPGEGEKPDMVELIRSTPTVESN